ncbi:MAG: hypothetical protein PHH41_06055 [Sulfurimonas sp.]|nr:hypothetical protein [Sulfurimonas sp.]MDD3059614.1 hypothetical protein [Sulfurimonas sp.]MDD5202690.1 hypothetical protein [Sulfurimonas sp.]
MTTSIATLGQLFRNLECELEALAISMHLFFANIHKHSKYRR